VSVTEARLVSVGLSGTAKGTEASKVTTGYVATYRVKVSDPLDTPDIVLDYFRATSSLPWIGRHFKLGTGFDASNICTSVVPQYIDRSGGWYDVACTFEDENLASGLSAGGPTTGETVDGKATTDPLKWHEGIEVSYTQYSAPVEQAIFRGFEPKVGGSIPRLNRLGAVVNSAGKPFDPPLEEEWELTVVRFTRRIPIYNGNDWNPLIGMVNNDHVVIHKPKYNFRIEFGPYIGKIHNIGATYERDNGIGFYLLTKELWLNPKGWRRLVLDQGIEELWKPGDTRDGVDLSASDFPVATPGNFNGKGHLLTNPTDPAVFMIYQTKPERSFAGINW
jgi:hypothetical protein